MSTGRLNCDMTGSVTRAGPFGRRAYTIIYAIDAPDIGRLKFGRTLNIDRRFRGLSNASPAPLVLVGYDWLPDETEAAIFHFLREDRCHGEWFHRTAAVRGLAALIAAKRHRQVAEILGMDGMLVPEVPSGVSWGAP